MDHLIIIGEAHLRRVLRAYADYYNRTLTHLSLNKDTPLARPILRDGRIKPAPCRDPYKTLFHLTLHSTFVTRSVVISSRAMDP